ncbi:MAG: FkbM family methyltransferase [Roseovarius sp.]
MSILDIKQAYLRQEIDKATFIERMFGQHKALYDYTRLVQDSQIKAIHIEAERVVFEDVKGVLIASATPDQRSAPIETLNFGSYEANEIKAMLHVIRDGDSILDIGGNIGWHSIVFSKANPNSEIWAFEPIPPVYDQLLENIALNGCKNVKAHNLALSDRQGEVQIFYDPDYSARSSARDLSGGAGEPLTCQTDTLDAFADRQDMPTVHVIKCDVEGAELFVFRGALRLIDRDKPAIFAEMLRKWAEKFDYTPNDIIALLRPLGYVCFELGGADPVLITQVDETTPGTNFLFLHPDTRPDLISRWSSSG